MKSLALYLQPRSRYLWRYVATIIVVVGCALYMALLAVERRGAAASMSQQIDHLRATKVAQAVAAPSKKDVELEKGWAALKAERDFEWSRLFNALERAGNAEIELLEFHPDRPSGSVLLRGEARDENALTDFVETLAHDPALRHVHLTHRKTRTRERLLTITFEIKANISKLSEARRVRSP